MTNIQGLNRLITSLEDELGETLDATSLDSRIKIQKLSYLAQLFDADFEYDYNMYVHGPYSPALAQDYYDEEFKQTEGNIPGELDFANFLDLVEGKSKQWLELATTIHKLYSNYKGFYAEEELDAKVISAAAEKKNTRESKTEAVYAELSHAGLLE